MKIKHQMLKFWNNFLQQLFLTRTLLEDKVVSMDNKIFQEQILMNLRNKDLYIQNPNPNWKINEFASHYSVYNIEFKQLLNSHNVLQKITESWRRNKKHRYIQLKHLHENDSLVEGAVVSSFCQTSFLTWNFIRSHNSSW